MKKIYLSLIAVAAIFTSCEKNEVLVDAQSEAAPKAIAFESFSQAATRATENNTADYTWAFFNHHETFQVWGFKNTSADAVFNGDKVTVSSDGATTPTYTYTYSPLRFWDKSATTYEYYAAAPSGAGWTFNGVTSVATQNAGYFTTSSTLTGTNLSNDSETGYVESFKAAAGDVDKLIAAPKTVAKAQFSQTVQLDFIHILSRLNVTIKKADKLGPDDHKNEQKVIMTSLEVKNLNKTGNFSEATAANTAGINTRWSGHSNPGDYTAVANTEVLTTAKYVLQSLVIPQDAAFESVALDGKAHASTDAVLYTDVDEYNAAKGLSISASDFAALTVAEKTKTPAGTSVAAVSASSKPYLVLTYTVQQTHDATGTALATPPSAETFTVYYNLANAFGLTTGNLAFNEGWQNTLNITIDPDYIEFCAQVSAWSTVERGLVID